MAPLAKNAKQAVSARQLTGGGMQRFFSKESVPDAAPGPAPAPAPMPTPVPTATPAEKPAPVPAPAAGSQVLTEEQRLRIAENRRKALERQQQKKEEVQAAAPEPVAAPAPVDEEKKQAAAPEPLAAPAPVDEEKKPLAEEKKAASNKRKQPPAKPKAAGGSKSKAAKASTHDSTSSEATKSSPFATAKKAASSPPPQPDTASPIKSTEEESPTNSPAKPTTPARAATPSDDSKATPAKGVSPHVAAGATARNAMASSLAALPVTAARGPGPTVANCGKERFNVLGCSDSWQQYDALYKVRLGQLRGVVLEAARSQWSGDVASHNFMQEISNYTQGGKGGVPVVIAGIIFRDLKARPNVVEDSKIAMMASTVQVDEKLELEKAESKLFSEGDKVWLEDQTMRIQLELSADISARLCTGLVMAVKGSATSDGKFAGQTVCFAPQLAPPPSLVVDAELGSGSFLALVSGLRFGDSRLDTARNRLAEFLAGRGDAAAHAVGGGSMVVPSGAAVRRVVVCGGVLMPTPSSAPVDDARAAVQEADAFLAGLCAAVPVDLMPGRGDPTGACLPQAPLLPLLFEKLRACRDFQSVGNPYEATCGRFHLIGHAGQPVDDMLRCSGLRDPLEALTLSLEARHLAPTAPDTLPARPLAKDAKDPFILGEGGSAAPHILFSGGHKRAGYQWHEGGTQCVAVPGFHSMPAAVLVNLCDPRDVRVVSFAGETECPASAAAGA